MQYSIDPPGVDALRLVGYAPALLPQQLGDAHFIDDHRLQYAYATGAMANAIASVELVEAVARSGMLGSYGAAGRPLSEIASAVDRLQRRLDGLPCAFNLIHSPAEPEPRAGGRGSVYRARVTTVEASAYIELTPAPVKYRLHGIRRDAKEESSRRTASSRKLPARKWRSTG